MIKNVFQFVTINSYLQLVLDLSFKNALRANCATKSINYFFQGCFQIAQLFFFKKNSNYKINKSIYLLWNVIKPFKYLLSQRSRAKFWEFVTSDNGKIPWSILTQKIHPLSINFLSRFCWLWKYTLSHTHTCSCNATRTVFVVHILKSLGLLIYQDWRSL